MPDFLTAGLDPISVLLLFGASFAGSFTTVALGIGGGAFLLAIMASLLPPAALMYPPRATPRAHAHAL